MFPNYLAKEECLCDVKGGGSEDCDVIAIVETFTCCHSSVSENYNCACLHTITKSFLPPFYPDCHSREKKIHTRL